jgi:hypothetical protein
MMDLRIYNSYLQILLYKSWEYTALPGTERITTIKPVGFVPVLQHIVGDLVARYRFY